MIIFILSIFMGLVISLFFERKMKTARFLIIWLGVSCLFLLLFTYIGPERGEHFINYYNILDKHGKLKVNNRLIAEGEEEEEEEKNRPHPSQEEEEEEEKHPPIGNAKRRHVSHRHRAMKHVRGKNAMVAEEEHVHMPSSANPPPPPPPPPQEEEEEEMNHHSPHHSYPFSSSSSGPGTEYSGPFHINISYNAQNSLNEMHSDNNRQEGGGSNPVPKKTSMKSQPPPNNPLLQGAPPHSPSENKNMGAIDNNSRIYSNSDWIYGDSSWSTDPDYYIPPPSQKPQELARLKNERKEPPCPLMVNTPWSEYKSGDSVPEPFNL